MKIITVKFSNGKDGAKDEKDEEEKKASEWLVNLEYAYILLRIF